MSKEEVKEKIFGNWNMSKCLFCKHCDMTDAFKIRGGIIYCTKKEVDMSKDDWCEDWRYRF